ncbi:MAG: DUF488 domain-containing protein [Phycisphaerales bacterium]|nr:DUF488 domain-containing protein [Phycisphaerales bacterium]
MIQLKRAYDQPASSDGQRILVERLWPRGVTKEKAALDLWLKEIAPSPGLRKWFGHDPARWDQFQHKYRQELKSHPDEVELLRRKARQGRVTLIYAAKDEQRNGALVLKEYLDDKKG